MLPFANLNNDPEQDLFIDGLTNDIITDLSKFSPLFVIAANSTFQYNAQLGQTEEAHAAIAEALKLKPDLNLEHEIGRRLENGLARANAEHLRAAVRKAGLPEKSPVLEP